MIAAVRHWSESHPGTVRTTNQDAFLCRPDLGLFVVADGVGSQPGGAAASAEVTRALNAIHPGLAPLALLRDVQSRLEAAHTRLVEEIAGRLGSVAATTVVALLLHGRYLACLWAGDSRAYLLRDDKLTQLTTDHSWVSEMRQSGALTQAEADAHPAANVITRAIGVASECPLVDRAIGEAELGDRFLLCSDGLSKTLPHAALLAALQAQEPARELVGAAIARGATDNVTAVVAELTHVGLQPELRT